ALRSCGIARPRYGDVVVVESRRGFLSLFDKGRPVHARSPRDRSTPPSQVQGRTGTTRGQAIPWRAATGAAAGQDGRRLSRSPSQSPDVGRVSAPARLGRGSPHATW